MRNFSPEVVGPQTREAGEINPPPQQYVDSRPFETPDEKGKRESRTKHFWQGWQAALIVKKQKAAKQKKVRAAKARAFAKKVLLQGRKEGISLVKKVTRPKIVLHLKDK